MAPEGGAAGVKLVCTAGPKAGHEFPLGDEDVVIGRATDNAISVPDTSVSRKHLKLRHAAGSWIAVDLGSGNGTLLNGELITEETRLGNGDVITLGDTEFRFVDEANATDRREVPVRRASRAPADVPLRRPSGREVRPRGRGGDAAARRGGGRAVMVFLLLAVLVGGSFAGLKIYTQRKVAEQRRRDEEIAKARAEISATFQEGKNLVRQGRWDEAKKRFEQVKEAAPDYPGVDDYLARAIKEIPNQVALDAADAALKANQLSVALEQLGKVSADTQQFQQLKALRTQLEEKRAARFAEAEEAMKLGAKVSVCNRLPGERTDASKYEEAVAITEDLLQAWPDDRDVRALNEDARRQIRECTKAAAPPPVATPKPWEEGTRQFIEGDLPGALAAFNACASKNPTCRQRAALTGEFAALYKKLDDLDAKGLTTLLSLDKKIGDGRTSKMGRFAGTKAANIYYKSATAAKTTGSWGRASDYAQRALSADPNHAGAQALLEEMKQKAKDLYLQAYANMHTDPDDSAAKFKDVVSMTTPSDPYHQKARARLQEIGK
jgi:pSer/pThr/pTyr-binding forkhead associated (FHA) protein